MVRGKGKKNNFLPCSLGTKGRNNSEKKDMRGQFSFLVLTLRGAEENCGRTSGPRSLPGQEKGSGLDFGMGSMPRNLAENQISDSVVMV